MSDDSGRDDIIPGSISGLEEKVERLVEFCRELRLERSAMQLEAAGLLLQIDTLAAEKRQLERRIDGLMVDRQELRRRVESMLDAIATLEMEAESLGK